MAIPNVTTTTPGSDNGGVDKTALFTKETKDLLIENYTASAVTAGDAIMHDSVFQDQGNRYYPVGDPTFEYQTNPGEALTAQDLLQSKVEVTVDNVFGANVISAPHIDNQSEIATAERARFARKVGDLKAKMHDVVVFGLMVQAGSMASPVTGNFGGSRILKANVRTDPDAFIDAVMSALARILERGMPYSDIRGYISPSIAKNVLWKNKDLFNRELGGVGSLLDGKIGQKVMGIPMIIAPYMPTTDMTTDANVIAFGLKDPAGDALVLDKYRADFSKVAAIFSTSDVVVELSNIPLSVKYDDLTINVAQATVVSWSNGYGVVNCAGSIVIAEP